MSRSSAPEVAGPANSAATRTTEQAAMNLSSAFMAHTRIWLAGYECETPTSRETPTLDRSRLRRERCTRELCHAVAVPWNRLQVGLDETRPRVRREQDLG